MGSLLDARAVQPGCSASEHLLALARSNGIDRRRVGEVLETVGLGKVVRKPARSFSLGMFQRLGLAAALLGDPPILVLDEPLNGLDPEGIIWFRGLTRQMAAEGRTILVSSHLMAEIAVTADHLLIIGEGRLLVDSEMETFERDHEHEEIRVRTPDLQALRGRAADAGGTVRDLDATSFAVSGLDGSTIGALALAPCGAGRTQMGGSAQPMILPKVRDPRFVTIRRGGTLADPDHHLLALWAVSCAEHVLHLFESAQPEDPRPREAIGHARAWARGEVTMMQARAAGGHAMGAARHLRGAARHAAYAAGQAGAVAHVAAHELGAAAYAIKAVRASAPEGESEAAGRLECQWQRDRLPEAIRELVLDDQRSRNDICWSVFDC